MSDTRTASTSRYCGFWKASNNKWYLDLAPGEYDEYGDATTYGPFNTQREAEKYLDQFSNPGGWDEDDSGTQPPPTKSPNGDPVRKPGATDYGGFRWASAQRVAARYLDSGRHTPPQLVVSGRVLLHEYGMRPVKVFFGEIRVQPSTGIVVQGEEVQDSHGGPVQTLVGINTQGELLLSDNVGEFSRLRNSLEKERLHHETPELHTA